MFTLINSMGIVNSILLSGRQLKGFIYSITLALYRFTLEAYGRSKPKDSLAKVIGGQGSPLC